MVSQEEVPSAPEITAEGPGAEPAAKQQMLAVEVRGGRTKGVLPTSVVLQVPAHSTVAGVRAELAACALAPHTVDADDIKLVYMGRALTSGEALSLVAGEASAAGELTLHAVLLGPGERRGAERAKAGGSVPASPVRESGPSPLGSPRYYSSQSSLASSPGARSMSSSAAASPQRGSLNGSFAGDEWVEGLKRQVELNMRKAFFDLIEKALSEEQPDPEWITRLYAEMRDKLCALTPRRTDMHKEIHDALDVDLFEQMVRHKAFAPADLAKLVVFVFGRLQSLCSPSRDAEVRQRRQELEALVAQPDLTFATFAVTFLKSFHATIEDIESDVAEFRKKMSEAPAAGAAADAPECVSPPGEPSPGGTPAGANSVREIKARLKQMGVADEILSNCVEKRELEALLAQATGRAAGTVSGGIMHPSLIHKPVVVPPAHPGSLLEDGPATRTSSECESQSTLAVNFKVMRRSSQGAATTVEKTLRLARDTTAASARATIARACGVSDEDGGVKLVHAGRVLDDGEMLSALMTAGSDVPLPLYVVLPAQ